MGVFVQAFDHWPVSTSLCSGNAEWRNKFLKYTREAIDVQKMYGQTHNIVPGNYDRTIPSIIKRLMLLKL